MTSEIHDVSCPRFEARNRRPNGMEQPENEGLILFSSCLFSSSNDVVRPLDFYTYTDLGSNVYSYERDTQLDKRAKRDLTGSIVREHVTSPRFHKRFPLVASALVLDIHRIVLNLHGHSYALLFLVDLPRVL